MKSFEQIAKAMYAAHCAYIEDMMDRDVPNWEHVHSIVKESWVAAARAAHKEISEVH